MTKILGTAAAVAGAFALFATPAFAASVHNTNTATIISSTSASANTGGNTATGSNGGSFFGANGGNTSITTGDAGSVAISENDANVNDTTVRASGYDAHAWVSNHNTATVVSTTLAGAATGSNGSSGSNGGSYGGGAGGNTTIHSGDAGAEASSLNIVNENVTHVHASGGFSWFF
jgi:hypothetical protein